MRKNSHERAELFERLAILLIILIIIIVGGIIGYKLSTGNTWAESIVLTFETLALVHRDSFIGWARAVEISLLFVYNTNMDGQAVASLYKNFSPGITRYLKRKLPENEVDEILSEDRGLLKKLAKA